MIRRACCVCAVAGLPAIVRGQEIDPLPTEHTMLVAPGAFVDLDTGVALPQATLQRLAADLRIDRDGTGFFFAPQLGGMPAGESDLEPGERWTQDAIFIDWHHGHESRTAFVRTDRGAVARVTVTIIDPYSTASCLLQWILAPAGSAAFLPAPRDLATAWTDGGLAITWSGDAPRYLIEVETDGKVTKQTSDANKVVIAGLAPDGVHHVRVRGLFDGGRVTLPAAGVQHGRRRMPMRGEVIYPDRWYDKTGGLSLTRGVAATADAEVVFYLYGVYVPGGGIQKIGRSGEEYRALAELPERGYLPVYGRIDANDVYAVRIADGRYAKLWIDPTDGSDERSGMHVHFAFLADGRRRMLAAPGDVTTELPADGVRLTWPAVDGAERYRVISSGLKVPVETPTPGVLLRELPRERMHVVEVVAIGADGEESDARVADVATYGPGFRIGRFQLRTQNAGIDLLTQAAVELRGDGSAPPALDLQFDGGAGNYNSMNFKTPFGACDCGELPFGAFPAADAKLKFEQRHYSDDRKPGFERFLLRTHDGGLASIRIRKRDSTAMFDYVLRLPPNK
jgi:hypothetical protein